MSDHSRATYTARFASLAEAIAFEAWHTWEPLCDVGSLPDHVREALAAAPRIEQPSTYWAWLEGRLDEQRDVTAACRKPEPEPEPEPEPCSECGGRGWDAFDSRHNGLEIERCDSCAAFPDDDEAIYAALKWWLSDEPGGPRDTFGTTATALLNSIAGVAFAALEPIHERALAAAEARVQRALDLEEGE